MTTETDYINQQLQLLIGTYEGIDTGTAADPVHAVRERAQQLLGSGASREQLLALADQLAAALPQDSRAVGMRAHWEGALEALEFAAAPRPPDPGEWTRQSMPAGQLRFCSHCNRETVHVPYLATKRNIGDNVVRWFCQTCWTNNGI